MNPREVFLSALGRQPTPRPATGAATSIATVDLMEETGCFFPEAHLDAKVMEGLAAAGHEILGFDNVMPLFSVCHESAAIGCKVDWGKRDLMPTITTRQSIRRRGPHTEGLALAPRGAGSSRGHPRPQAPLLRRRRRRRQGIRPVDARLPRLRNRGVPHQHHPRARPRQARDGDAEDMSRSPTPRPR